MPDDAHKNSSTAFSGFFLAGTQQGQVKRLSLFDKSRHTAPKFASERAQLFLGKISREELEHWAEKAYSDLRKAMDYKRREISLDCADGLASIRSKDFELCRRYSLVEDSPEYYIMESELGFSGNLELASFEPFSETIGPLFDRMRCVFQRGLVVEEIIDAVEASPESRIEVDYPSSCQYCDCRIQEIDATFRFDSEILEIRFPSFAMSAQLVSSFASMSDSFRSEGLLIDWL